MNLLRFHFSDMQSVSNILAGELLVDVDRVCSCCDDDDIAPLQEYLLRGRGCLILSVLNTIGVQVGSFFLCLLGFIIFDHSRQV